MCRLYQYPVGEESIRESLNIALDFYELFTQHFWQHIPYHSWDWMLASQRCVPFWFEHTHQHKINQAGCGGKIEAQKSGFILPQTQPIGTGMHPAPVSCVVIWNVETVSPTTQKQMSIISSPIMGLHFMPFWRIFSPAESMSKQSWQHVKASHKLIVLVLIFFSLANELQLRCDVYLKYVHVRSVCIKHWTERAGTRECYN